MSGAPTAADWLELFAVLGLGGAAVVCLTALVERCIRSAVWRRTLWQTATIALLVLLAAELTGAGGALSYRLRRCTAKVTSSIPTQRHHVVPSSSNTVAGPEQQKGAVLSSESAMFDAVPVEMNGPASDVGALSGGADDWPAEPNMDSSFAALNAPAEPAGPRAPERTAVAATNGLRPPLGWWPGAVWIVGAMLAVTWFVAARVILAHCRRRRCSAAGPALRERVAGLAHRLAMRRRVAVVQASSLAGPIAFGVVRPTIVLPAQFDEQYDAAQQDAILVHELAHLAACDPAWYALSDLTAAALWWHPLVWWSRARLRASSELAADEASQIVADGPRILAACLVALGSRLTRRPAAGWARMAGSGFRSGLGRRVERLMQLDATRWSRPRRALRWPATLFGVLLLSALVCGGTTWARWNSFEIGESTMNPMHSAWRKSVAGMLVAGTLAWTHPAPLPAQDEASPAVPAADAPSQAGQAADDLSTRPQQADATQDAADAKPTRGLAEANESIVEITVTVDGQPAQAEAQVKRILQLLKKVQSVKGVRVVFSSAGEEQDEDLLSTEPPAPPAERLTQAQLEEFGPPSREEAKPAIRVFRLQHRDPKEVATIVGALWEGHPRIVVDQRTRSLLVRGMEYQLQSVAAIVGVLDVADGEPAGGTEGLSVLQLRYIKAKEVAELLRSLGAQAQIVPDERLNRLLVAGTPEEIAEVRAVIKELDVEASTPAELLDESDDATLYRINGFGDFPDWQLVLQMTALGIRVTGAGQIQIGHKVVEPDQLGELIRGAKRVQIVADAGATYSKVQSVIDACKRAGAKNVRVSAEEHEVPLRR